MYTDVPDCIGPIHSSEHCLEIVAIDFLYLLTELLSHDIDHLVLCIIVIVKKPFFMDK